MGQDLPEIRTGQPLQTFHNRYFSEYAFEKITGIIPYDKMEAFFWENLK